MAVMRERPYPRFNFHVDFGTGETGQVEGGFARVILPQVYFDVIEYRTGNWKENSPIKLPGLEHSTNLVLERGVIGSLDLYHWWNQVRNGDPGARRTVTVQLLSEDRTPVVTLKFLRAWPVKYSMGDLQASGNDVAIETIEIAFERFEME